MAGSYTGTVTVSYRKMDGSEETYTQKLALTITPKQLTIAAPTVTKGKVYDGTTTAQVTAGAIEGVVTGDEVTASATATYDSADVGTDKKITVKYTLVGADQGNYLPPVDTEITDGTVAPKKIGKYVTSIGSYAFSGCTKLNKVFIGNSVTTIGSRAFYKCTSLTNITIPSKVTKIGNYVFRGCSKLKTIKINTTRLTTKTVSKYAFSGVSTSAVVKVPKSKLKTYKTLFVKRGLNKKVTIR